MSSGFLVQLLPFVVVSDKNYFVGHLQEPTKPAIPVLLAVGAVHHHLILNGLRMSASIVAETAQCFSTHQFACLIGYGARYLHYLVFHLISWPFELFLFGSLPT